MRTFDLVTAENSNLALSEDIEQELTTLLAEFKLPELKFLIVSAGEGEFADTASLSLLDFLNPHTSPYFCVTLCHVSRSKLQMVLPILWAFPA